MKTKEHHQSLQPNGEDAEQTTRATLRNSKRVIIKVGTRVLVDGKGRPDPDKLAAVVSAVAGLRAEGREVILVSSGAIGTGMDALGLTRRPKALSDLQMCAAVGQSRLMELYAGMFKEEKITVGQVLLTYEDLRDRKRHLNARNTFFALLRQQVLPIVNENDVVSVAEIKFGDNDVLASLVGALVDADAVLLLSTTDGLRKFGAGGRSQRVSFLPKVNEEALKLVTGSQNQLSSGGMSSKLLSAQRAVDAGALVVIVNGLIPGIVASVLAGDSVGTLIGSRKTARGRSKKRWIKFFQRGRGSVTIDDGAVHALLKKGGSLLPVGVKKVDGSFRAGDPIDILSAKGELVGKGLVEFSASEVEQIRGKRSAAIRALLGECISEEIVHRDNLVLVGGPDGER